MNTVSSVSYTHLIHAPAYLYTSLKQPIDYKKVIHVEDQNLQRLVIDDEEVNIDKIGEYPLHIMAYDETGNCVKPVSYTHLTFIMGNLS